MFQLVGHFAFDFHIQTSFKKKIRLHQRSQGDERILHTCKSHYTKKIQSCSKQNHLEVQLKLESYFFLLQRHLCVGTQAETIVENKALQNVMMSPQYTPGLHWIFFGGKCHLSGLCSHRHTGAAPALCRAVLLVPWSATPLLGSSDCLCHKPLQVEPCQNLDLEVRALLVGSAERQLFKI